MGGGIMQLALADRVQQDQYFVLNPQISYFKYAYKKHTNFAMESIELTFQSNPRLHPDGDGNTYECRINPQDVDLLSNVYFCFTLPEIYSSNKYKFRWIENVGNIFVKKATISLGSAIIDSIVGEWLSIWNELSLKDNKSYNRLVGQIPELTSPTIADTRVGVRNNKFYYIFYPASDYAKREAPSIKSKRLYVPLNFWFTRNPALALPICRLQFVNITITIHTRSSEYLYQVWSDIVDMYVSPTYYNMLHNDNINIHTFAPNIALNPVIDINCIFLDHEERNAIINASILQYVVEQVYVSTETRISSKSSASVNIALDVYRHTKEILWTVRRSDYINFNIWNNYTASPTYNEFSKIITNAIILWDRTNSRIDKDADYFGYLQPYQHHTNVPRVGIYCYSFALFPEKINPTGSYNGNTNTSLQLQIDGTYNNEALNEKLRFNDKPQYEFDYLVNVYAITMNVFEINGNVGGLKFA